MARLIDKKIARIAREKMLNEAGWDIALVNKDQTAYTMSDDKFFNILELYLQYLSYAYKDLEGSPRGKLVRLRN